MMVMIHRLRGRNPDTRVPLFPFPSGPAKGPENVNYPPLRPFSCSPPSNSGMRLGEPVQVRRVSLFTRLPTRLVFAEVVLASQICYLVCKRSSGKRGDKEEQTYAIR